MILLDRVSVMYSNKTVALSGVNLHIAAKEFVSIVGPSGAGKSSLIKLLIKEADSVSGKVIVDGTDYDSLTRQDIPILRRRIGVVFQDFKLLPNLNVYENVAFALEVAGVKTKDIKRAVPKILHLVGLSGKVKSYPHEISGGEKQRAAIARALIRNPKILIADEPTGNLDPKTAWDIIELLLKINRFGTTVLLTTHNKEIVNSLKKRVITINRGRIVKDEKVGRFSL
ncbi:cell division ATP-binding protein FtsE [Candidatus Saccharibacteria bacterium]|nr:cell division ATP-binding protein FtsE [Candidatus Saccharibacteria bacterium]MCB9834771.1 cell division ATP-binding protein FtsE [Candidatus Nomurabacteria bacterium]